MRSPLSKAVGLGSAKAGTDHWWVQRVTAVALVPLGLWLVGSLVSNGDGDYHALTTWLGGPVATTLMALLLIALFYHAALGLQVVVEDYVHSSLKIPALIAVRLACIAIAGGGILATLRIATLG